MRAWASRSLAWSCVCFECCGLRHRGCRLEYVPSGRSCGLPRVGKPSPPAPPGSSCLVECGVCPSASGPCWGLRLASGPQRHGVASGLAHLSMGFTHRIRRSASLHWPLAGGPLKSRAFAYRLTGTRALEPAAGGFAPRPPALGPGRPLGQCVPLWKGSGTGRGARARCALGTPAGAPPPPPVLPDGHCGTVRVAAGHGTRQWLGLVVPA